MELTQKLKKLMQTLQN